MNSRLVYLDNIRIFLISYVIVGHISVAYGAIGGGNWYYIEPARDIYTKVILYLVDMFAYSFLMAMFIFIAGYFTPASLDRKGSYRFLKERMIRLFVPLVFYYFIIGPLVRYVSMLAREYDRSLFEFLKEMYASGVYGYLGVMWFVALILTFSFLFVIYRQFFPTGIWQRVDDKFPRNTSILTFIILLGLFSFLSRTVLPIGGGYLAARPLASVVLFGAAFFLGTIAFKYQWLDKLKEKQAWQWFWVALFFMIVPLVLFVLLRKNISIATVKGAGSLGSLLYSFWEVIKSVGTGMIVLILFRKYFNTQGNIAASMGRSSFAAFVFHPLVCVVWMLIFSGIDWHPLLKFAIVAPLGLVCTFVFSWLILMLPGMKRVF